MYWAQIELEQKYLSLFFHPSLQSVAAIYAEVEIPVASNLRPLVDKTIVASNLESITVSSDVDMFYFTLGFK